MVFSVTESRRQDTPPAYNLVVRDIQEQEEVEEEPPSYDFALRQEIYGEEVKEEPPDIVETCEIDTNNETDLDKQKSEENLP